MSTEFQFALDLINGLGTVGALVLMVVAFLRGDIITKSVFDRVLLMYEKQLEKMTEIFFERLNQAIDRMAPKP